MMVKRGEGVINVTGRMDTVIRRAQIAFVELKRLEDVRQAKEPKLKWVEAVMSGAHMLMAIAYAAAAIIHTKG